jgi:hypothetical protein
MPMPGSFRLLHSQFNAFLFAPIAEEANGMPLSVLSALTRLGIDPWQEAARLAALPRDVAAQALSLTIARAIGGDRTPAIEPRHTADRLVALLPANVVPDRDQRGSHGFAVPAAALARWVAYLVLTAALAALLARWAIPWWEG